MKSKSVNPNLNLFPVAAGVWGMKDVFVNLYMVLNPADNSWVLVDSGLKWSAAKIRRMAQLIFGEGAKPSAIVLTHGHFDHTGSVAALAELWDVPVYAHHLELPYLTGLSSYPPADTTVGGGLFADLSFLYSRKPIDISGKVTALPAEGKIPGLADWEYIHTPGHSPGHISLFRAKDRVLIAGDAVVTTKAESFWFTALQLKKISGPPKYLTSDWLSAAASVEELAGLEPSIIASGHGRPIRGSGMRKSLHNLAEHFDKLAVPYHGRYIHQPALADDSGVVHIPPKNSYDTSAPTLKFLSITIVILITAMVFSKSKKRKKVETDIKEDKKLAKKYRKQLEREAQSVKKPALSVAEEIQQIAASAIGKMRQSEKVVKNRIHALEKAGKHKFQEVGEVVEKKYHEGERKVKKNLQVAGKVAGEKYQEIEEEAKDKYHSLEKSVSKIKTAAAPAFMDFLEKVKFDVKKTVKRR